MGLEVIIGREDTGGDQFFGEDLHEVQEVFRVAVADVIHRVGRDGEAVGAGFLFRGPLHHPQDAFHDVVDIGKIPLAVAVVENLDGFALQ